MAIENTWRQRFQSAASAVGEKNASKIEGILSLEKRGLATADQRKKTILRVGDGVEQKVLMEGGSFEGAALLLADAVAAATEAAEIRSANSKIGKYEDKNTPVKNGKSTATV